MAATRYVVGFCFTSDKSLVRLIRKNRPKWQEGKLNGVGGHIEEGEDPISAMVREFKEETGAETQPSDWREFALLIGDYFQLHCFVCFDSKIFCQMVQATDEELVTIVPKFFFNDKCVSNLPWLLYLCLDEDAARIVTTARYSGESDA